MWRAAVVASTATSRRWLGSSRRRLRQGARAVAVLIWLGLAGLLCLLLQWRIWRRPGLAVLQPFMQPWFQVVVHLLGVRQSWAGRRPAAGTLLLCNHISWLDIVVIGAQLPVRFVAKAEVRRWPLLGALAAAAGTVFLQRGRRSGPDSSAEVTQLIAQALAAGELVLLFPEGTTSDGRCVRRFQARLIPAGYPVAPLALAYRGDGAAAVPFLGNDNFAASLWRLLAERDVHAHLHCLAPVTTAAPAKTAAVTELQVATLLGVASSRTERRLPVETGVSGGPALAAQRLRWGDKKGS